MSSNSTTKVAISGIAVAAATTVVDAATTVAAAAATTVVDAATTAASAVNADATADENESDMISSFDDLLTRGAELGIDENLLLKLARGILSYGFEHPSLIQKKGIIPIIKGGDVIAQAQSGTGKTGAFSIGLLARADLRITTPQALVLSPTRELAAQTQEVISRIGEVMFDEAHFCKLFVGGTRTQDDMKRIPGTIVPIGTPGRILDLLKRSKNSGGGGFDLSALRIMIIDEADQMLSQGFAQQINDIFPFLPRDVQIVLVSATMPDGILELSNRFMREPTKILLKPKQLSLPAIKQYHVPISPKTDEKDDRKLREMIDNEKWEIVIDLFDTLTLSQAVIFVNSRSKADTIVENLKKAEFQSVEVIHSDLSPGDRENTFNMFRNGKIRVLIGTDLIARGIDVHHVNIVVNYDLPPMIDTCHDVSGRMASGLETYLHRIGRSGRHGRTGVAISFVSKEDIPLLNAIENHFHVVVDPLPMDFLNHLTK
jgi:translation initiation factor 4A